MGLVVVQLFVPGLYIPPVFGHWIAAAIIRPRRSFHCRSTLPCAGSSIGRIGGAGGCPTIGDRIVSPPVFERVAVIIRHRRSFRCRSRLPCDYRAVGALVVLVSVPRYPCQDRICRQCFRTSHGRSIHRRRSFHHQSILPFGYPGEWGTLVMLVAVQLSETGIVFTASVQSYWYRHIHPRRSFHCRSIPPCDQYRAVGALVVLIAVQLSVLGLYLPPVFKVKIVGTLSPPQTIISLPVHTAV